MLLSINLKQASCAVECTCNLLSHNRFANGQMIMQLYLEAAEDGIYFVHIL